MDSGSMLTRFYCGCRFVQRVWIALEEKGIPYQYSELERMRVACS